MKTLLVTMALAFSVSAHAGLLCDNAKARGDSGGMMVHCNDTKYDNMQFQDAAAKRDRGGMMTFGNPGISMLCKNAIASGDRSAIMVHCA